jgi:hypothetical protein
MRRNNLQCLCLLCHSQKDELHRRNFSKRSFVLFVDKKSVVLFATNFSKTLIQSGQVHSASRLQKCEITGEITSIITIRLSEIRAIYLTKRKHPDVTCTRKILWAQHFI